LLAFRDRDTVVRMTRHFLSPVVTKAVAALVFGCALSLFPTHARAQDPAAVGALGQGFGAQGQLAISGELAASFDKVNHEGWLFLLQPSADYFVVPSISAGLVASLALGNNSLTRELIGARAGYNLNLTERLGVWGKLGVAYQHSSSGTPSVSTSSTYLTVDVPILYHIAPHLFVGIGPYYYLKVAGDGNTGYGFHSLVGGWF
jgi:hypothetical protein